MRRYSCGVQQMHVCLPSSTPAQSFRRDLLPAQQRGLLRRQVNPAALLEPCGSGHMRQLACASCLRIWDPHSERCMCHHSHRPLALQKRGVCPRLLLMALAKLLLPLQMELCSWMGAAPVQATLVEKMPDTMRKDVERSIQEAPAGRKQPERFTRKEQARRAAAPAPGPTSRPDEAAAAGPAASAAAAPEEEEVCSGLLCATHLRHLCPHKCPQHSLTARGFQVSRAPVHFEAAGVPALVHTCALGEPARERRTQIGCSVAGCSSHRFPSRSRAMLCCLAAAHEALQLLCGLGL